MIRSLSRRRGGCPALVLLLTLAASLVVSTPHAARADAASDAIKKAITERGNQYLAAVTKGDVEAALAIWTPEAVFIDALGQAYKARDVVKERLEAREAGAKPPVPPTRGDIRVITPEVAIEDLTQSETSHPAGALGEMHFSVVWVLRDKQWLIDSVRESLVVDATELGSLHELAWMVGSWQGVQGDATAKLTVSFTGSGHFLRRDFELIEHDKIVHSGTQFIAWDPETRRFRSWAFDSAGGFHEGVWHHEGQSWVVASHGFLADGSLTQGIDTYELNTNGHLVRKVRQSWVGNQQLPDGELVLTPVEPAK